MITQLLNLTLHDRVLLSRNVHSRLEASGQASPPPALTLYATVCKTPEHWCFAPSENRNLFARRVAHVLEKSVPASWPHTAVPWTREEVFDGEATIGRYATPI